MSNSNKLATPTRVTSSRDDVLQFLDSLDSYSSGAPTRPSVPPAVSSKERSSLSNSTRGSAGPPASSVAYGSSNAPSNLSGAATNPTRPSVPAAATSAATASGATEAQSVLDFLDEITQRSATPTASVKPKPPPAASTTSTLPTSSSQGSLSRSSSRTNVNSVPIGALPTRKSTDSVRSTRQSTPVSTTTTLSGGQSMPQASVAATTTTTHHHAIPVTASDDSTATSGGWGWSSMWNQATNVVQQASHVVAQARTVAEEQVASATQAGGGLSSLPGGLIKALGENEQAKKWSEGVMGYARGAHLDQIGKEIKSTTLRSLTELLNAVAPPIAEHEVLQVSLSHDMVGYDGVEALVYRSLSKVMEQVEGGTLIVNKGAEETSRPSESNDEERDLNLVEGLEPAWKLAEANLDQLIKTTFNPQTAASTTSQDHSLTVPVTTCPIYMRIQPCLAPIPFLPASLALRSGDPATDAKSTTALFFLIVLKDPTHALVHSSLSQSIPSAWLDIPFEENEWVEDVMVDVIRRSVECIGQEYISHRMRARTLAIQKARDQAQRELDETTKANEAVDSGEVAAPRNASDAKTTDADTSQVAAMAGLTI